MSESQPRQDTVGLTRGFHPDAEMNVIGWLVFLPLLIIILPLLPFIALYLLVSWLLGERRGEG